MEACLVTAPPEWGVFAQGLDDTLAVGVDRPFQAQPREEREARRARKELHQVRGPPKERVAAGEVKGEGEKCVRLPRGCVRDEQYGATSLKGAPYLEVRVGCARGTGIPGPIGVHPPSGGLADVRGKEVGPCGRGGGVGVFIPYGSKSTIIKISINIAPFCGQIRSGDQEYCI